MNFEDYSSQAASQLGPETERFCDTIGSVTKIRRIIAWTVLILINLVVFAILIGIVLMNGTGTRLLCAAAGLIGVIVVDAVVIYGMKNNTPEAMVGIHHRGIVVGDGTNCWKISYSELIECREMSDEEVRQLEAESDSSEESIVWTNTEQHFLGFEFRRSGRTNCRVLVFQNREVFEEALTACSKHNADTTGNSGELRTWTAKSGHRIEAAFRTHSNGLVLLVCPNGSFVKVAIDTLTDTDQSWILQQEP